MGYAKIVNAYRPEAAPIFLFKEVYALEKIHGCIHPDSRVMLPNGEERTIGEVIADTAVTHVLSYDVPTGVYMEKHITGRFRREGDHPWVRLTLASGRTLVCTADHPVFSRDRAAYVPAGELRDNEDIESPIM